MITSEAAARAYVETRFGSEVVGRLEVFLEMLREENARQNLVAASTIETAWVRHLVDSLQLVSFVAGNSGLWLDLGTGAGFPGLVVAIADPHRQMVLIESRRRRCEWLDSVISRMRLKNCRICASRLELVETVPAAIISARAFAPMDRLIAMSARFSTKDTVWLLPKGRSARQELALLPAPTAEMFHVEQSLTDHEAAILVGQGRPEVRR